MERTSPVTETLKPCPFCGATPHRGRTKLQRDQLHGHLIFNYRIWCPHDCASKKAPSEELAVTAWNSRFDFAQTPAHDELLRHWQRVADKLQNDLRTSAGFETRASELAFKTFANVRQKTDIALADTSTDWSSK